MGVAQNCRRDSFFRISDSRLIGNYEASVLNRLEKRKEPVSIVP
jgi:hypothetical protein